RALDRTLGGLKPGNVTVVGARASMGKTSLALGIAVHVASHTGRAVQADGSTFAQRYGVCIFSMEMLREELAEQLSFTVAGVNLAKLKEVGKLDDDEWRRLASASAKLSTLPIYIDDTPALTSMALRAKARRVRAEFERKGIQLGLVVVDYLQ